MASPHFFYIRSDSKNVIKNFACPPIRVFSNNARPSVNVLRSSGLSFRPRPLPFTDPLATPLVILAATSKAHALQSISFVPQDIPSGHVLCFSLLLPQSARQPKATQAKICFARKLGKLARLRPFSSSRRLAGLADFIWLALAAEICPQSLCRSLALICLW